jgi:formamidopyrimidine-DNA glycosylase
MPELPEVETVARTLRQTILGRRIQSVRLGKTDFIDDPAALEQHLPGRRIEQVERYGKFMLLRLSEKDRTAAEPENPTDAQASLLVHLGMTGHLAPATPAEPAAKHTHVWLELDDGRQLRYTDPRRFGRMAFLSGTLLNEELVRFGAEPLEITDDEFVRRIRSRKARIKALLLDQSVLRGVGNIYADESLWRAKIHPARLGKSITRDQARVLRRALQDVLRKAISLNGSSISDFLDPDGEPGSYQMHHRAYGREGKPCFRCRATIRRTIVAGRSSFYCPRCQHAPRAVRPLPLFKGSSPRPKFPKRPANSRQKVTRNKGGRA